MRKLVALSVTALLVAGLFAGVASAGKKKKPTAHQHVEGSILLPQGGNAAATCVYRAQRTLFVFAGEEANGTFGHTFEVDPKTAGLPFKLEGSAGAGLDISFYADLGDPTDPTTAPANIAFENPGPGGESGTVPAGFPYGFVCLTEGANATFSYMAGTM